MRGIKLLLATLLFVIVSQAQNQYVQPMGYKDYSFNYQINVGRQSPGFTHPSAYLELGKAAGSVKGFLLPRVSTAGRDSISAPATGLMVFNITTGKTNVFDGTAWVEVGAGITGNGAIIPADLTYVVGTTAGAPTAGSSTFTLPAGSENFAVRLYRGRIKQSTVNEGSNIYYAKGSGSRTLTLYGDAWQTGELVQIEYVPLVGSSGSGGSGAASWGSITGSLASQTDLATELAAKAAAAHTHSYTSNDITNKPTLGTSAALNVASSGNAAAGEVVKGNDTRLTDARTPTSHNHLTTDVTEGTNLYFTEARVRASLLTGYTLGSNVGVSASDNILAAIGKIQAQLNNKQASGSYLTSESDPVYTAGIANYYTKVQADARYLQSYTETDPYRITNFSLLSGAGTTTKTLRIVTANGTNHDASFDDLNSGSGTVADASTTTKGIVKLSVAPATATDPIAVGTNDSRMSDARTPLAHTHSYTSSDITNKPTLGTASSLNVAASGNAATGEVVKGNDTRLSDARTPLAHAHDYTSSDITNKPTLGTSASLNVAASGNAAVGEVVKGNDTRLSDSRTPLTHTHAQTDVTNLTTDLAAKASLASPTFSGTPTVPTATAGTNNLQAANTAFVTAALANLEQHKAISLQSPTGTENVLLFYTTKAITVTNIADVVRGTTPSATWNISHGSSRTSATATLFSSDRVTSSTTGATTTTFANASIAANSWVWITTSAVSGTVDEFSVVINYK